MGYLDCTEHKITSEETWNLGEYNVEHHPHSVIDSLQKYLKTGEYIPIVFLEKGSVGDLENSVNNLKEFGLDIGKDKENKKFGHDIWPQKEDTKKVRRLSIYRRRN